MMNNDVQPQTKSLEDNYFFCYEPDDLSTLVMLINIENMPNLNTEYGEIFPNFVGLLDYPKINMNNASLIAMINQDTASAEVIIQFCRLARRFYPKNIAGIDEFEKLFLGNLNKQQNQSESESTGGLVLKEYVKNTFFHRMLNNLIRSAPDSTYMFYGHYFIRNLCREIQNVYAKYEKREQLRFVCYRGARLEKEEIQILKRNIGGHIETLGFLSTSLSQEVALNFAENALFVIEVPNEKRDPYLDHGYAFLSQINQSEQEVLFNVLCNFQVKSVEQVNYNGIRLTKVHLRYGSVIASFYIKVTQEQKQYSSQQKELFGSLFFQKDKFEFAAAISGQLISLKQNDLQICYLEKTLQLMQKLKPEDRENIRVIKTDLLGTYVMNYFGQTNKYQKMYTLLAQLRDVAVWKLDDNLEYNYTGEPRTFYHKLLTIEGLIYKSRDLDKRIDKELKHMNKWDHMFHAEIQKVQEQGEMEVYPLNKTVYDHYIDNKLIQISLHLSKTNFKLVSLYEQLTKLKQFVKPRFSTASIQYSNVENMQLMLLSYRNRNRNHSRRPKDLAEQLYMFFQYHRNRLKQSLSGRHKFNELFKQIHPKYLQYFNKYEQHRSKYDNLNSHKGCDMFMFDLAHAPESGHRIPWLNCTAHMKHVMPEVWHYDNKQCELYLKYQKTRTDLQNVSVFNFM